MYTLHLFAGAGGGILGDLLLGHTPIGAVEIEEYPRKVLLQRQLDGILPVFPIWDDVTTFREDNPETAWFIGELKKVRHKLCICGGFPCQDISIANSKAEGLDGERSGLWRQMERIISEIRPGLVFIENSSMLTVRGGTTIIRDLARLGYMGSHGVLGGVNAGLCADGKRIWILANEANSIRRIAPKISSGFTYTKESWRRQFKRAVGACLSASEHTELLRDLDGMARRMGAIKSSGNGQMPAVVKLAWEILG